MDFIDLKAQQKRIRAEIEEAILGVLDHGRYIMGPEVAAFESQLGEFLGVEHVIGCSSGTDALLLPLLAFEVGPGDAVFVPPFTFFATCETVALTGATPVFVDVDPQTFNIDPDKLAEAVEKTQAEGNLKPKGIIPVDLFGLPADYDRIMPIAEAHGLFVLEDAAQAFGAEYQGRRLPGFGEVGATSFFPAKPLGGYGDAGAVFTDDGDLAAVIRSLLVHGQGRDKYNNVRIGLNARIDTMQAAILIQKLKLFEEEIALRQAVAERYTAAIEGAGGGAFELKAPHVPEGYWSVWAQYTVLTPRRDELRAALSAEGIPTAVYYEKPMHLLDAMAYLGGKPGDFPVSEHLADRAVSLPMHPYLSEADQGRIFAAAGL